MINLYQVYLNFTPAYKTQLGIELLNFSFFLLNLPYKY